MSDNGASASLSGGWSDFLTASRTIAKPGFNRWMVPPAALVHPFVHRQAYAFSVFKLPMTKLTRHHAVKACPA